MAVAAPASIGRVNASGNEDALFLKVFSGEVLTAFERSSVTQGAEMVRSISSGKSASFPVMGRISAAYHVPGAEIVGTDVNHNEKVITINDLLVSSAFLSNIEEAKNHWDVRSSYSSEIGRALAHQKDLHVLQTMGQAALTSTANITGGDAGTILTNTGIASATAATAANAMIDSLFDAASNLDSHYVPKEGRKCFLRLEEYYKLANATNAVNIDLVPTPHFISANIAAANDQTAPSGKSATIADPQAVNLTNFVALVTHPSACGTVQLMNLATEMEYDIRRQGTLMVAKYAMGHGVLRPEAAIGIKEA
mgnify:CR=1 FL=1